MYTVLSGSTLEDLDDATRKQEEVVDLRREHWSYSSKLEKILVWVETTSEASDLLSTAWVNKRLIDHMVCRSYSAFSTWSLIDVGCS